MKKSRKNLLHGESVRMLASKPIGGFGFLNFLDKLNSGFAKDVRDEALPPVPVAPSATSDWPDCAVKSAA